MLAGMANIQIDAGKLPDIGVGYEPSSSHHNDQLTNNYFPRVQFPNCVINSFSHFWNIGDHCLAPWTDGQVRGFPELYCIFFLIFRFIARC